MITVEVYRNDQSWSLFEAQKGKDHITMVLREHPDTCVLCDGSFDKELPCGKHYTIAKSTELGKIRFIWVPNCWRPQCAQRAAQILEARLSEVMRSACTQCGRQITTPTVKMCSGCHKAVYCGVECQKAAWSAHKPICKKADQ